MVLRPSDIPLGVDRGRPTEWLLFTSGTTGRPKIVVHTLDSLTGPLRDGLVVAGDPVWSTFYDIRRYGGLTILFRALIGGASMVLSQADEAVTDFLARAGQAGVTHISGTPVALAARAHELRRGSDYATLCAPVGGGGGPGHSESVAPGLSQRRYRPRLRPRPKPDSHSMCATDWPGSRRA